MFKRLVSLTSFLLFGLVSLFPQTYLMPNVALKSHQTLDIMKVVMTETRTEIYLKIENKIRGGTFCADKNIYIVLPDGTRSRLVASNGIPVCPDTYKFSSPGEQLDFVLTFQPVGKGIGSVDLIEDCQENCFSFYGIILDASLNEKIDNAFALVENGDPAKALVSLASVAEENANRNQGATGLLYMNIIQLYNSEGNAVRAGEWYKKLESSGLPEKKLYLEHLNSIGIKY